MKYLLFYFALSVYGCSSSHTNEIQRIYNNRNTITDYFLSKSIMRSRGQNIILFYTHSNNKTNKYFFEIDNNQYRLTNDSIEYVPELLKIKNESGSELYKQELISTIKKLVSKMDELGIRDISSQMAGAGIVLKIYMKSKGVVLYVPNPQDVTSPRFKDYINSMQKLDNNWYYTMNE